MVWASADVGSGVYLNVTCKGMTDDKVVSLSFDDGPDEVMTPKVLDVLKEYDVKAAFFVTGNKAEKNPGLVRRMVEEGHIVANHSYSHSGLFPLGRTSSVEEELEKCNNAIFAATGIRVRLFRPPFGVTNPIIGRTVRKMNLKTIGWSIRSLDTIKKRDRQQVCKKIVGRLHPGAIILLHDRCENADLLLKMLISQIMENGYRCVSIGDLIKTDVYEN